MGRGFVCVWDGAVDEGDSTILMGYLDAFVGVGVAVAGADTWPIPWVRGG